MSTLLVVHLPEGECLLPEPPTAFFLPPGSFPSDPQVQLPARGCSQLGVLPEALTVLMVMIFNIQTAHWKLYGCPASGSTNLRKQHAFSLWPERAQLCAVTLVTALAAALAGRSVALINEMRR